MQIPRLIMHSVQGKIGLTTTPASLKWSDHKPI